MIASPGDLVERILQHFLESHVHDMSQDPALRVARTLTRGAWKIENIAFGHQWLEGRAESLLETLSIVLRDLKSVHDVGRHVPAGAQQRAGMTDLAAVKDGHVSGSP